MNKNFTGDAKPVVYSAWPREFNLIVARKQMHRVFRWSAGRSEVGDVILLKEWDEVAIGNPEECGSFEDWTGREIKLRVTAIREGPNLFIPEGGHIMEFEHAGPLVGRAALTLARLEGRA